MMKEITKGIVFSNDIKRIIEGNNSLNYTYKANPSLAFYEFIRNDFKQDVTSIFQDITIISEEKMLEGLLKSLQDISRSYPHCFTR